MLYFCTETVDDKLSWMEVLNAATESLQAEPQDKFEKRKKVCDRGWQDEYVFWRLVQG